MGDDFKILVLCINEITYHMENCVCINKQFNALYEERQKYLTELTKLSKIKI